MCRSRARSSAPPQVQLHYVPQLPLFDKAGCPTCCQQTAPPPQLGVEGYVALLSAAATARRGAAFQPELSDMELTSLHEQPSNSTECSSCCLPACLEQFVAVDCHYCHNSAATVLAHCSHCTNSTHWASMPWVQHRLTNHVDEDGSYPAGSLLIYGAEITAMCSIRPEPRAAALLAKQFVVNDAPSPTHSGTY